MSIKRRDFLKTTVPAAVLPAVFSGISMKAFGKGSTFGDLLSGGSPNNENVLVLVQLNGGNDGLNMVIPIDEGYAKYQNARSNIAIPETKVLKLEGVAKTGLHSSMKGLQTMYNEGKLAIVQSVGYPQPNFSHFRATDIWMTASDTNQVIVTGWMGRYLNNDHPNFPNGYPNEQFKDPLAIQIGSVTGLALQGPGASMGMSISNPASFYQLLLNVGDPAPNTNAGKELKYLRTVAAQTDKYTQRVKAVAADVVSHVAYPANNSLGDQLKIVAKLIKGGLKTKVYMVQLGGFDTHSLQTNTNDTTTGSHARLMQIIGDALKAFQDDCEFQKIDDRVMGMTFSEFGRRIKSNSSVGTDHGAASPLFVFGKYVKQQVLGVNPTIPNTATVNDNIPMQYDFRSIYATLLQEWLCVPNPDLQNIMLKNFQLLPLVEGGVCKILSHKEIGVDFVRVDPNPVSSSAKIIFKTNGGHTLIQIIDTLGRVIATPLDKVYATAQSDIIDFPASRLSAGLYYIRLQNEAISSVKSVVKVN